VDSTHRLKLFKKYVSKAEPSSETSCFWGVLEDGQSTKKVVVVSARHTPLSKPYIVELNKTTYIPGAVLCERLKYYLRRLVIFDTLETKITLTTVGYLVRTAQKTLPFSIM